MELHLKGFNGWFTTYGAHETVILLLFVLTHMYQQIASRWALAVRDVELHDCLVTSPFRKFLCYYNHSPRGREYNSCMLRLVLTSVRPEPDR